jgi:hypothetical protein
MSENIESWQAIEKRVDALYAAIDAGLRNIEEHTDGPFEMTLSLKEIETRTEVLDAQLFHMYGTIQGLAALVQDLQQQRDQAAEDRESGYIDGWLAAMSSREAWRWVLDALHKQGQDEAANQIVQILAAFRRDYQISKSLD